jgi:hypothetical protein
VAAACSDNGSKAADAQAAGDNDKDKQGGLPTVMALLPPTRREGLPNLAHSCAQIHERWGTRSGWTNVSGASEEVNASEGASS